jgi:ferric-dicitrate binding protein FerR (iron transport regulator)
MPENIWFLLVRKLTKEATAAELRELDAWFSEHSEDKGMAGELLHFWNSQTYDDNDNKQLFLRHLARLKAINPAFSLSPEAMNEVENTLPEPGYLKRNVRKILSIAAIFVVLLASVLWAINQNFLTRSEDTKEDKLILNEVQTKPGSRSKIVLPDGTEVWVNATSRLLYEPDFGKKHRKVKLDGEAYFQVAKNKDIPFEIETKRITIKVTGTIFNVRAYDDEEKAETSLFEGSVHVTQHLAPNKNYILRPNQKLIIDESTSGPSFDLPAGKHSNTPVTKKPESIAEPIITEIAYDPIDSLALETSWLYSTLAFNDESFLELSKKMEKWYGVEILFESKRLEKTRFTGRFTTETIQEALEALQFTAKFKFRKEKNSIIIF